MIAMNSTLILLNALALAVLVIFQLQPDRASGDVGVEMVATYKPLKPMPTLAVMHPSHSNTARLAAEQAVEGETGQGERWVF